MDTRTSDMKKKKGLFSKIGNKVLHENCCSTDIDNREAITVVAVATAVAVVVAIVLVIATTICRKMGDGG